MKKQWLTSVVLAAALLLVACAKKESPAQERAVAATTTSVSAEQQAAIDAVDKPNPEAIAVAVEDVAASAEMPASEAHDQHTTEHQAH
ncbi:MAG: hypothetical protein E6Q25_02065 [Acinetobacter sp.]|nr:MAG: hypothetical protein E6Q25_02065 [Acinetobacter sp.]